MFKRPRILTLLAGSLLGATSPPSLAADERPYGELHLNGYSTLAATHADTAQQADFRTAQFQSVGSGRTRAWDFANDSNLALQLAWDTPYRPIRLMTQVIAASDTYDDIKPRFDWLYVGWQPAPIASMRFGRYPTPSGMQSETRWVGSSRLEVRAPLSIYSSMPFASVDGADLSLNGSFAGWTTRTRISYGWANTVLNSRLGDTDAEIEDLFALSLDASHDAWRLYIGGFHTQAKIVGPQTQKLNAALSQVASLYPPAQALADDYTTEFSPTWQIDAGLEFQQAPWSIRIESLYRHSKTKLVLNLINWNATVGYTIGRATPFFAMGQLARHDDWKASPLPPGPPAAVAAVAAYNASLVSNDELIISAGLRWDFDGGLTLKGQYDQHRLGGDQTRGVFVNVTPEFIGRTAPVHVFTLALDYQF